MKTKIVFLLATSLMIFGCNHNNIPNDPETCLPEGWLPMPQGKIMSYIPARNNSTVIYVSENGDTMTFKGNHYAFDYDNAFCDDFSADEGDINKGIPYELMRSSIRLYQENGKKEHLEMSISINQRTIMIVAYDYYYTDVNGNYCSVVGWINMMLENDSSKDQGLGWPKYPNQFMDYLTDTIELKNMNNPNETYGMLVAGKGLVWFTGANGLKWYLHD